MFRSLLAVVAAVAALPTIAAAAPKIDGLDCDHLQKQEMMPFGPYLSKVNDAYYKIQFMDDNYPGQIVNGQVVAHPIYGTYVLADYVATYYGAKNPEAKETAKASLLAVAQAAVCHMEALPNGGIAFYYRAPYVVGKAAPYYSAITQAQYLNVLFQTGQITGEKWATEAAERVALSIMLPGTKGGVTFIDNEGHPMPQEYPGTTTRPPQFVLNGWFVVLLSLKDYADRSHSETVREFVDNAFKAVDGEIDKYDAPEVGFSFYKLSDVGLVRIIDGTKGEYILEEGSVDIPGVGTYQITAADASEISGGYSFLNGNAFMGKEVKTEGDKTILTDGAVSYLWLSMYPETNHIHLKLRAVKDGSPEVQIISFKPSVMTYDREDSKYVTISGPFKMKAGETKDIEITIPREQIKNAMWPIPHFKAATINGEKKYGDVYHATHISLTCAIAKQTKDAKLAAISNKWHEYTKHWDEIEILKRRGEKYVSSSELLGIATPWQECKV